MEEVDSGGYADVEAENAEDCEADLIDGFILYKKVSTYYRGRMYLTESTVVGLVNYRLHQDQNLPHEICQDPAPEPRQGIVLHPLRQGFVHPALLLLVVLDAQQHQENGGGEADDVGYEKRGGCVMQGGPAHVYLVESDS